MLMIKRLDQGNSVRFTNQLNTTGSIIRRVNTGNNVDPVYSDIDVVSDVPGLLDQLSEKKVIRDDGGRIIADHVFFIDYVSGILGTDRAVVGSNEYNIYRVRNPNGMNRHLEIYMLLVQPGTEIGGS